MTDNKVSDMSNNELSMESLEIYNEYEATKNKVNELLDLMDRLEARFKAINRELILRNV